MVKIVDNYTLTDYLGKGAYGKVYKATNIDTAMEVAIKMIPLYRFEYVNKLAYLTRNEIYTLKLLYDNLNVVSFVEMIKTNNYIYLVYEYCEGGTLEQLIRNKGRLEYREAIIIFRQLINAFKELYELNIIHRDIKSDNIFFKSGHLKLADFGFCKRLRANDDLTQTSLGSPIYMAPYVMNGGVYGNKADLWSCGIVLYEMLFGHCPFAQSNIKYLLTMYNRDKLYLPFPNDLKISPVVELMLRRMLYKDQFRRITWYDYFYYYEFTHYGTVNCREKDFEYDLMKLMKKNSVLSIGPKQKERPSLRFDWSKITNKNSSVHSYYLGEHTYIQSYTLDHLLLMKRKIKYFYIEHSRLLYLSCILYIMLYTDKYHQYSHIVLYFIITNLQTLLTVVLGRLKEYHEKEKELINAHPTEKYILDRLLRVFYYDSAAISFKINSMKISLLDSSDMQKDVLSYPKKSIMRKYLKQFLQQYYKYSPHCCYITPEGNKQDTYYLLKVVWAVAQNTFDTDKDNDKLRKHRYMIPNLTYDTKQDLSVRLSHLLVMLGL